jgi:hypothetical protein
MSTGGIPSIRLIVRRYLRVFEVELAVLSFNQSSVSVRMAPGAGTNLSVVVVHGGSGGRGMAASVWSFDPPVVEFVTAVDELAAGSGNVTSAASNSTASGGSSTLTTPASVATYDLPCNSSASCRRVWFPATSGVLEVHGANFGADAALGELDGGIVVLVGGVRCVALEVGGSVFVNDTLLRCRMSSASSVGRKVVSVFVGGQWATVSPSFELVALCSSGFVESGQNL